MEIPKMDASRAKARLTRKSRPSEGGRGGKAARPIHPAKGMSGRVPRVVKARAGRPPIPANDTLPLTPEEIGAPELTDLEVRAPAPATSDEAEAVESEASEAALAAGDGQDADDADEDADGEETTVERKRGDDEPASFLAMYFRDMAELDVLRPEQEFETARNIEQMELDLWRTVVGFAPGTGWILDIVERELGKPLPEAKLHRAAAERARRKSSIQARSRFEKTGIHLAAKLRLLDIDRIFIDAALAEIQRVGRATKGLPIEGTIPFSTSTKAFADYVRTVSVKAMRLKAAKNEFVKANLRLVVSIARRFNHGRLPLADLIQEGNIGLMKAVERYDYHRGFRFSTYASWWIRHAISRALADKGRAVRLPVHMIDAYHRIAKSQRELQS